MANVDYNRSSDASFQAWVKYCRSDDSLQNQYHVQSFVAGYNAAMAVPSFIVSEETLRRLRYLRQCVADQIKLTEALSQVNTECDVEQLNWFDALIANCEDELKS